MADIPAKPVLLTGASGNLGRVLARNLGAAGWTLVLTDITPFPDALPPGARFTRADLGDGMAILRLAEGCGMILHFGGMSTEASFEAVLGPNLRGLHHIYEAARRERARVLFASSNHSIGFHERSEKLDADCQFLPDDDLTRLCIRATLAEKTESCVIWGASANSRTYWAADSRAALGWLPQDSADGFAGQLGAKVSGDPINERYQGGIYTTFDYTRSAPPPGRLFR
jgi:uronate dehydrogenase